MEQPLRITMHGIAGSPALEAAIRDKAARLEQFDPQMTSCHVTVELRDRHKHKGKQFTVRLDIKTPGGEIAVNHDHHEDPHVALRDAFDAARRQLEDHVRRRRGDVKTRSWDRPPGA